MIKIENNYYDIDICECCNAACDPDNIKLIFFESIARTNCIALCKNCRKLLLNKLKEDLNEI